MANANRKASPGRRVDLLVCGELLSGTTTAEAVYVHIDVHSVSTGTLRDGDVSIWNGRRFVETRKTIKVVDLRPRIKF